MAEVPRYKSFFEKLQVFVNHVRMTKEFQVDAFFKLMQEERHKEYFYRGLSRASYKLYTTGQRYWIEKDLGTSDRFPDHHHMYQGFLHHLKSSAHMPFAELFKRWGLSKDDDLALLSFLQHAGAPTPMLDMTEDPFVALYFASTGSSDVSGDNFETDEYFSVVTFPRRAAKAMNREYKRAVDLHRPRPDMDAGKVYAQYMFFSEGLALVLHPDELQEILGEGRGQVVNNLNIINQKGLFVYTSTADLPLMELIRHNEARNPSPPPTERLISSSIRCVDIHRALAGYVQDKLAALQPAINEDFIFPKPANYFHRFVAGV